MIIYAWLIGLMTISTFASDQQAIIRIELEKCSKKEYNKALAQFKVNTGWEENLPGHNQPENTTNVSPKKDQLPSKRKNKKGTRNSLSNVSMKTCINENKECRIRADNVIKAFDQGLLKEEQLRALEGEKSRVSLKDLAILEQVLVFCCDERFTQVPDILWKADIKQRLPTIHILVISYIWLILNEEWNATEKELGPNKK